VATTHAKQEELIRGLLATVRAHEAEIKRHEAAVLAKDAEIERLREGCCRPVVLAADDCQACGLKLKDGHCEWCE
jgi:phosphoribosylaminoimidazole-succinocarboxamide synthase